MTARLTDLRYVLASPEARGLYLQLYLRRSELQPALALHAPEAVAGAVLGCSPTEASSHLATLRAAGLVGEGLTLIVGTAARTRPAVVASVPAADDLRDRAKASGRSVSELARAAGLDRSALSRYLAGDKGLGAERSARLAAALGCAQPVPAIPCEKQGVPETVHGHSGVHSTEAQAQPAPSAPPASPVSPGLPSHTLPSVPPSGPSNPLTTPAPEVVELGTVGEAQAQAQLALGAAEPTPIPKKPSPARELFEHWQRTMGHPKAVLTDNRRRVIKRALKSHGLERCRAAITGCTTFDWNMGRDPRTGGKRFDGIELILRDAAQIERFEAGAQGRAAAAASAATAAPPVRGRAPLGTYEEFAHGAANPIDASFYQETGT